MTTERKIALISGGSSGLGLALAQRLAAEYHPVLLARSTARLEMADDSLRQQGIEGATLVPMDLRDHTNIDSMIAGLYQRFGRLDLLVGAAATICPSAPLAHCDPGQVEDMYAVNLLANFRLLRASDALLRQARAGMVVMITGRMGVDDKPNAFTAAFDATRAALETLTLHYALELSQTPLRAVTVDPGAFASSLRRVVFPGIKDDSLPSASEKAEALAKLILDNDLVNGRHYTF